MFDRYEYLIITLLWFHHLVMNLITTVFLTVAFHHLTTDTSHKDTTRIHMVTEMEVVITVVERVMVVTVEVMEVEVVCVMECRSKPAIPLRMWNK